MVQLNWKISAMAVTGATAIVGWVAAPPRVETRIAPVSQRSSVTAPPVVRVLRVPVAPRVSAARHTVGTQRNPFRFPTPVPPRPATPAVAADVAAPVIQRAPVPYHLSGVAKATDARGQDEWTAVLAGGPNGVVLGRAGDLIDGRYRVSRLDGDSVTLVDQQDGVESTLPLGRRP